MRGKSFQKRECDWKGVAGRFLFGGFLLRGGCSAKIESVPRGTFWIFIGKIAGAMRVFL
jgi:hypothetical protein